MSLMETMILATHGLRTPHSNVPACPAPRWEHCMSRQLTCHHGSKLPWNAMKKIFSGQNVEYVCYCGFFKLVNKLGPEVPIYLGGPFPHWGAWLRLCAHRRSGQQLPYRSSANFGGRLIALQWVQKWWVFSHQNGPFLNPKGRFNQQGGISTEFQQITSFVHWRAHRTFSMSRNRSLNQTKSGQQRGEIHIAAPDRSLCFMMANQAPSGFPFPNLNIEPKNSHIHWAKYLRVSKNITVGFGIYGGH